MSVVMRFVCVVLRASRVAVLQEAQINPACTAAGLEGFPTWVIGGQKLSGEQSFDKLEAALTKSTS